MLARLQSRPDGHTLTLTLFPWHGRTQYAETRMCEPVPLLIKLLFGFPVRFGKTVTEEARQGAIQLPLTSEACRKAVRTLTPVSRGGTYTNRLRLT